LENLKLSLQLAYKIAGVNIRKAHVSNKTFYDRKATVREFKEGDLVYLFNPARKPRSSKTFWYPWRGHYYIIAQQANKLHYRIKDIIGKVSVVHVNRLQKARNQNSWREEETKPASN
jgi:hypothetical protein